MKAMINLLRATTLGIVFASVAVAAVAQHAGHGAGHQTTESKASKQQVLPDMEPAPTDSPFMRAFKEAHLRMMHDMHFKLSGDPDRDFVRGMIPHHQGAIDMAKVQLAHGKDPELRKLAEQIIKDQEKEIAHMNGWLQKNGN